MRLCSIASGSSGNCIYVGSDTYNEQETDIRVVSKPGNQGVAGEEGQYETIVQNSNGALFNNASQVLNHVLYFTQFQKPSAENKPQGYLKKAIEKAFNSFENFKNIFEKQGISLFGSGWVWLSSDDSGNLIISQEENAKNPITKNLNPILTFDVWEHAYYIDFRNNRAEHLKSLWQIINWDLLELRYTEKHRYHF